MLGAGQGFVLLVAARSSFWRFGTLRVARFASCFFALRVLFFTLRDPVFARFAPYFFALRDPVLRASRRAYLYRFEGAFLGLLTLLQIVIT